MLKKFRKNEQKIQLNYDGKFFNRQKQRFMDGTANMNIIESLNRGLEIKYHLNEAKEDKERFLSFINATIKDNVKSQAIVDNFDKLKSSGRIKGEEADYYYWVKNRTVDELQDFLNAFNSTLSKTQTKKQEKEGAELIPCLNKDWVIYKITTYDASKYYGENTHWCITGRNGSNGIGAFNHYKQLGVKDYYFLWKIGDEENGKWCYLDYGEELNINNEYFYDAHDHSHMIENVDIPKDVLLSLSGISKKTFDDMQEKQDRKLKQSKIMQEVQKTGVYTYNPVDDAVFIQNLNPKKVIVPNSVKEIREGIFSNCTSLQEINIPNSVTQIGEYAFYGCASLQKINIPDRVEKIGNHAFSNCTSLQEITISNSVTQIESSAFYGCASLKEITIPNSVTQIGNSAFYLCISLKEITIPNSVTQIGEYAFYGCASLQKINIPDRVEKIGNHAFSNCTSLQEITIPNSVTQIGEYAFYLCNSLKEIYIKGEYRPQIFKPSWLKSTVILNWVDCGIKETRGDIRRSL